LERENNIATFQENARRKRQKVPKKPEKSLNCVMVQE